MPHLAHCETAAPPPDSFVGYHILREIHRGGQGVVYQAIQQSTNREVAIKVMKEGPFAGAADRARFEREIQILGQLRHPSIVAIHDCGVAVGSHYFVMDYVAGQSLDEYVRGLRDKGVSREEAQRRTGQREGIDRLLMLFTKVCEAVHAAHLHGVIHRDLKPGNIRIDESGNPHILDFGLAKTLGECGGATDTGQFIGSLPWASPEQAEGHSSRIDIRTDVYSLGVILYRMLTGRLPYEATANLRELMNRIVSAAPIPPRAVCRDVDDELETILLKCLAKDPEQRYQSAGEVAREVGRYISGEPIEAKRESVLYTLRKSLRRHRAQLAASAAIAVILAVSSLVSWTLYVRAQGAALTARRSEAQMIERLRDARLAQAHASRLGVSAGRRFEALGAIADAARIRPSLELRNEAIAAMNLLDVRPVRDLAADQHAISICFDRQVTVCAVVTDEYIAKVLRVADGAQLLTIEIPGGWTRDAELSDDGRLLLLVTRPTAQGQRLRAYAIPSGQVVFEVGLSRYAVWLPAPDGQEIVMISQDRKLHTFEMGTRRERDSHPTLPMAVHRAAISPDGTRIAVAGSGADGLAIVDLQRGTEVSRPHETAGVWCLDWSSDGRRIAAGLSDGRIRVFDASTGAVVTTLLGHAGTTIRAVFSQACDMLVSQSWDGTSRLWDLSTSQEVLRLTGGAEQFGANDATLLCWRQSGRQYQPFVAEIVRGDQFRTIACEPSIHKYTTAMSFGPGRLLFTGSISDTGQEMGLRIWDLERRERLAFVPTGRIRSVLLAPDKSCLFTAGDDGLLRWPLRLVEDELHLGPPKTLARAGAQGLAALSADGGRLVCLSSWQGSEFREFDAKEGREVRRFACARGASAIAISRSGRWVACGKWHGDGAEVWDMEAGRLVTTLPTRYSAGVAFSPDERSLVVTDAESATFWRVGTWQREHAISGHDRNDIPMPLCFSPDGRMVAVGYTLTQVGLFETARFEQLATLERTNAYLVNVMIFGPHADELAIGTNDGGVVQVWDLRKTRENLAKQGLDWDAPPYSNDTTGAAPAPIRAHINRE